jgi:arsenite methyltransferase
VVTETCHVYEQSALRQVLGDIIRPGGLTLTDRALAWCALSAGARVLDVGCGPGATIEHLRAVHHLDAFGFDSSALLLQSGRRKNAALLFAQAPGERLPLAAGQLDAVIAECSLSVMADPDRALAEFRRVLQDKGTLILSDVYARNPDGIPALRRLPVESCLSGAMSRQQIAAKLRAAGFDIILWEDHADALKHLTTQFIMSYGSMPQFWQRMTPPGETVDIHQTIRQAKLGYYVLMARKGNA